MTGYEQQPSGNKQKMGKFFKWVYSGNRMGVQSKVIFKIIVSSESREGTVSQVFALF